VLKTNKWLLEKHEQGRISDPVYFVGGEKLSNERGVKKRVVGWL
jgi:hypothetical protein